MNSNPPTQYIQKPTASIISLCKIFNSVNKNKWSRVRHTNMKYEVDQRSHEEKTAKQT